MVTASPACANVTVPGPLTLLHSGVRIAARLAVVGDDACERRAERDRGDLVETGVDDRSKVGRADVDLDRDGVACR